MPIDEFSGRAGRQRMREVAFSTAIGAALMLYFGWGVTWFRSAEESIYSLSIPAFVWLLRIGGILAMIAVAALWVGFRPALIYDAVVGVLVGLLMALIGAIWLAAGDWQGFLLLIFGAMFIRSGWGSWVVARPATVRPVVELEREWGRAGAPPAVDEDKRPAARERLPADAKDAPTTAAAVERNRPPAIPEAPRAEEPPPAGFLAELGRDDSERK